MESGNTTGMKKWEVVALGLPIMVLLGFATWRTQTDAKRARRTAGPFRLVIDSVSVTRNTDAQADQDAEVRVVIDHAGREPKWWGSQTLAITVPRLQVGGTHLVDENGRRYTEERFREHGRGIYGLSMTFDPSLHKYVYTYLVRTRFIPNSVNHLTFKSKLIYPTTTLDVSAVVRPLP
jgi:hypothetical protein